MFPFLDERIALDRGKGMHSKGQSWDLNSGHLNPKPNSQAL